MTIDEILTKPYWIIDILPMQVPENRPDRFFAAEKFFLEPSRFKEIKQKHINLILKLNCYMELLELVKEIARGEGLFVWQPGEAQ